MTKTDRLRMIEESIRGCTRCESLCNSRTNTVPGEGSPNAVVMFVGEAPGEQEDKHGTPFCGPAGELLTGMITACGWRREDVFIANVLKCRPPGNRRPSTAEAANCWAYLELQIKTVNPRFVVCLGASAANRVLNTPGWGITGMRGKLYDWNGRKVLCTFHPSYILHAETEERADEIKRMVWDDLQLLVREMKK
jgi:uracil-DNA glycosylase family 4